MWQSGYTSCHWVAALCRWPHQDKTAIQQLPACRISAELRGCSLRGTVGAGWQWVLAASIGHASNPAHTLLLTIYLRVLANPQLVGHLSLDFFFPELISPNPLPQPRRRVHSDAWSSPATSTYPPPPQPSSVMFARRNTGHASGSVRSCSRGPSGRLRT